MHYGIDQLELVHYGIGRLELVHYGIDPLEWVHDGICPRELVHYGIGSGTGALWDRSTKTGAGIPRTPLIDHVRGQKIVPTCRHTMHSN